MYSPFQQTNKQYKMSMVYSYVETYRVNRKKPRIIQIVVVKSFIN